MLSIFLLLAAAATLGLSGAGLLVRRLARGERGAPYDAAVCLLGAAGVFDMPGPRSVAAVWAASLAAAAIFRRLRRDPTSRSIGKPD